MDKYLTRSSSSESLAGKRSAEDLLEWKKPKRRAFNMQPKDPTSVSISNRFSNLQCDEGTENASVTSGTAVKLRNQRVPPIIIDMPSDWTHQRLLELISLQTKTYHIQYRRGGKVSIFCHSNDGHKKVVESLKSANSAFFTYTRKEDRTYKSVVYGLPAAVIDCVQEELAELGFSGVKISKLEAKDKQTDYPPLLIQLPAGSDMSKFKHIKYLCSCSIKISKFQSKKSPGTQCFRCQSFGHTSRNCNLPERCVKCTECHPTKDCKKKDRDTPAKCCNCGEDHPANFQKCKARVEYLENLAKKKVSKAVTTIPPKQPIPVNTYQQQTEKRSWAQVTKNSKTQSGPQSTYKIEDQFGKFLLDPETQEMLEILSVIKNIKDKFSTCQSMVDKVILLLTHLGNHI